MVQGKIPQIKRPFRKLSYDLLHGLGSASYPQPWDNLPDRETTAKGYLSSTPYRSAHGNGRSHCTTIHLDTKRKKTRPFKPSFPPARSRSGAHKKHPPVRFASTAPANRRRCVLWLSGLLVWRTAELTSASAVSVAISPRPSITGIEKSESDVPAAYFFGTLSDSNSIACLISCSSMQYFPCVSACACDS